MNSMTFEHQFLSMRSDSLNAHMVYYHQEPLHAGTDISHDSLQTHSHVYFQCNQATLHSELRLPSSVVRDTRYTKVNPIDIYDDSCLWTTSRQSCSMWYRLPDQHPFRVSLSNIKAWLDSRAIQVGVAHNRYEVSSLSTQAQGSDEPTTPPRVPVSRPGTARC